MSSRPRPDPNAALLALRLQAGEEPGNAGLMLGRPPVESPPLPPVKLPPAPWSDTRKQEAVQNALLRGDDTLAAHEHTVAQVGEHDIVGAVGGQGGTRRDDRHTASGEPAESS